jgi:hypothetical protein
MIYDALLLNKDIKRVLWRKPSRLGYRLHMCLLFRMKPVWLSQDCMVSINHVKRMTGCRYFSSVFISFISFSSFSLLYPFMGLPFSVFTAIYSLSLHVFGLHHSFFFFCDDQCNILFSNISSFILSYNMAVYFQRSRSLPQDKITFIHSSTVSLSRAFNRCQATSALLRESLNKTEFHKT